MDTSQLEQIVRRAVEEGISPSFSLTTILFVCVGATSAFGAWLATYMKEKGRNFATKEDLEQIIQQQSGIAKAVENVKAEVTSTHWQNQQIWSQKLTVFTDVSRNLLLLKQALERLLDFLPAVQSSEESEENMHFKKLFAHYEKQLYDSRGAIESAIPTVVLLSIDASSCLEEGLRRFQDESSDNMPEIFKFKARAVADTLLSFQNIARSELHKTS